MVMVVDDGGANENSGRCVSFGNFSIMEKWLLSE